MRQNPISPPCVTAAFCRWKTADEKLERVASPECHLQGVSESWNEDTPGLIVAEDDAASTSLAAALADTKEKLDKALVVLDALCAPLRLDARNAGEALDEVVTQFVADYHGLSRGCRVSTPEGERVEVSGVAVARNSGGVYFRVTAQLLKKNGARGHGPRHVDLRLDSAPQGVWL